MGEFVPDMEQAVFQKQLLKKSKVCLYITENQLQWPLIKTDEGKESESVPRLAEMDEIQGKKNQNKQEESWKGVAKVLV